MTSRWGTGGNNTPIALAENIIGRKPENGGNGDGFSSDLMYTLNATGVHGVAHGISDDPSIGHCLRSGASKADKPDSTTYITGDMRVRRLTPMECERLQGFPDNYTNIPNAPDTGRYKALGNSMAVPVMRWIGERIEAQNLRNLQK
jgi:site-specific DNA-cytosine methylase